MPTSESTHIMCGHVDSPPTGKQCLFCIYLNIISPRQIRVIRTRIPIPFLFARNQSPRRPGRIHPREGITFVAPRIYMLSFMRKDAPDIPVTHIPM
jgi:hypothetical protein